MRVVALVALVALAWSSSAVAQTPAARLAAILRAGASERSVHYISVNTGPGVRIVFVGDAARNGGVQHVMLSEHGETGHATAIRIGRRVYVEGDAFGLTSLGVVPAATARKNAGKWLRVVPGDRNYAAIAEGIDLADVMSGLDFPGSLLKAGLGRFGVSGKGTVNGKTATAFLYASKTAPHLPVRENASDGKNRSNVVLSHWNEAVRLVAPNHSARASGVAA